MCKKKPFSYTNFQKSPYRGKPPPTPSPSLVASLPRFGIPLTNPGCITVTGIAKGYKPPPPPSPPLDLSKKKNFFERRGSRGLVYVTSHNQPPNNGIQCVRNVIFIHKLSKNLPHTLPPLSRFAPSLFTPR